ncbi:MAG: nucleoid-associated protein [Flavobacteriales bacterium]
MLNLSRANITQCIIHRPGNKSTSDPLWLADGRTILDDEIEVKLRPAFLKCFSQNFEFYQFTHRMDLKMNDVYACAENLFKDEDVIKNSQNIAAHLHDQTKTASIKSGDLFVILFENVKFNEEDCTALGLFKCETKESVVAVTKVDSGTPQLQLRSGIGDKKPDKACLIINKGSHDGYHVLSFEKNQAETDYWQNQFLGIQLRMESDFQTKHVLTTCKDFIGMQLPEEIEMDRLDQINFLEKSSDFFNENEEFRMEEFTANVFEDDGISESFASYKHQVEEQTGIPHLNAFAISEQVAKKEIRGIKCVIKLDQNFDVYVRGDRDLIERGVDEEGRNFYKLYFDEET